jgi:hypothetical protein
MTKLKLLIILLLTAVTFFYGAISLSSGAEPVSSARLLNPVILDGQITSSYEWAETYAYNISLDRACCWPNKKVERNAAVMTVRFKNDDKWLYMLYKIAWLESDTDPKDGAFIEIFIGPYGPPWAESDFGALSFSGETIDLYGWDDTRWQSDIEDGGQNDVEGAASYNGKSYWFEFRKKLNSGDGFDWTLEPPQIVTLMIGLFDYRESVTYEKSVLLNLSR